MDHLEKGLRDRFLKTKWVTWGNEVLENHKYMVRNNFDVPVSDLELIYTGFEGSFFNKSRVPELLPYFEKGYIIIGECSDIYGEFPKYENHEVSNGRVLYKIFTDDPMPYFPACPVQVGGLPVFRLYTIYRRKECK